MTSHIRFASTAVILAVALGLGGCAANRADITAGTGTLMQSTVVLAANQAAAGDAAGVLTTLDSLQAQLRQGSATGDITADRAAAIQNAIDLVRADLQPAVAPVPEETAVPDTTGPETTPTVEDTTDDSPDTENNGNNGNNGNDKEIKKQQEKEKKEAEKAQKELEKAQKELEKENEK